MGSETQPLHILFFPFMAPGHMNPMIDMAKLFARRGVTATILTTPANTPLIQPAIDRAKGKDITVILIPFPSIEAGLPEGCENCSSLPSLSLQSNFLHATSMLCKPFDQVLAELAPDCVVTDEFLPWTCDIAAKHGIPRLAFDGTCFFARCALDSLARHNPLESLLPDAESFVLPGLPHRIEMLRSHIPDATKFHPAFMEMLVQKKEAELRSYGLVVNSFCELEPGYAEHYRDLTGWKAWHVGPVSLCNKDNFEMPKGGSAAASIPCLEWLDGKAPGTVLYVCFGSLSVFTAAQLKEMALGLEEANHPFIWCVRDQGIQNWMPQGFEERTRERGLLIRGWAPQVLILDHPAVGGFMTHCGWNSSLEGATAGVPLATWPLFAEQFYNERLIVDVMGIGVSVGVKEVVEWQEETKVVEAAEIKKAVRELMGGGEEAEGRRRRARKLREKARWAVEEGGSSYVEVGNLMNELMYIRQCRRTQS